MHMLRARTGAVGASLAVVLLAGKAAGQTTVEVNFGQIITEEELAEGRFLDQMFTLDPETTFQLNGGGGMQLGEPPHFLDQTDLGGASVNINRGSVLSLSTNAFSNGVFNLFDGGHLSALPGQILFLGDQNRLNIRGGRVQGPLILASGSTTNMSGGAIQRGLTLDSGAVARVSGGSFGRAHIEQGSEAVFVGGEFTLNGQAIDNLDAGLGSGGVFTGTLADGTVFILSDAGTLSTRSRIDPGALALETADLAPVDTTPIVVGDGQRFNKGLRAGQTLMLTGDGRLGENFAAVSARLDIEGGVVGDGLKTVFSEVAVSGGSVGDRALALDGSRFDISGGSVGDAFTVGDGAQVFINGGSVGRDLTVSRGAEVSITGGSVQSGMRVNSGGQVVISGGAVGDDLRAHNSQVAISGGRIGDRFSALSGSSVALEGGSVGQRFQVSDGSDLTIRGGEFTLDGQSVSDLSGGLASGGLMTGTLADGSVFIFNSRVDAGGAEIGDFIAPGAATLEAVDLAPADTTPMVVSTGAGPERGLRPGQTLTLTGDATLRGNFAAVSSTLNVDGGAIGDGLETAFGEVNVSGGEVGRSFNAFTSDVNISGGVVGRSFDAFDSAVTISGGALQGDFSATDSEVTISGGRVERSPSGSSMHAVGGSVRITGGEVERGFTADASEVAISGGRVGDLEATSSVVGVSGGMVGRLSAIQGSEATLTGGRIGGLEVVDNGAVTLAGGEFTLDGQAISDLSGGLNGGGLFTGTLADGSVFIFNSRATTTGAELEDVIAPGAATLTLVDLAPADTTPMVVTTGEGPGAGLRPGQSLTLAGDGTLGDNFAAVSSTLNVEGGVVGDGLETAFSEVNISGGAVGQEFTTHHGEVNITGGAVGQDFRANDSAVSISGGVVQSNFGMQGGSLTISGGELEGVATLSADVAINGGVIDATVINSGTLTIDGGAVIGQLTKNGGEAAMTGGRVGRLTAANGSRMMIDGGRIGSFIVESETPEFFSESEATIRGGLVEGAVSVRSGGILTLEGGVVGDEFEVRDGGLTTIRGGEFTLNGQAASDLTGGLNGGGLFTGTLADGTVFIFNSETNSFGQELGDFIAPGAATLDAVDLAPADTTPMVVSTGEGPAGGLRPGQNLTLAGDGTLRDNFAAVSSTLTVEGGAVGDGLETAFSEINISGGRVGSDFEATGSEVSLTGGSVGRGFRVDDTNALTITGGEFMLDGETISDLSGGLPSGAVLTGTLADGSVFIFNTSMGDRIDAGAATLSQVNLAPADTTPMVVTSGAGPEQGLRAGQRLTLSGTGALRDHFAAVSATLDVQGGAVGDGLETAFSDVYISGGSVGKDFSASYGLIEVSGGSVGDGFRAERAEVSVTAGSVGEDFTAIDSVVSIEGGDIGRLAARGSEVRITGGLLGDHSTVDSSSLIVSGGVVQRGLELTSAAARLSGGDLLGVQRMHDSRLTITGGTARFEHNSELSESTINIRGGEVSGFIGLENSAVNIFGGDVSATFGAFSGSINLFVTDLLIDGEGMDLAEGDRLLIAERDGALLEATLSDGSFFDLILNDRDAPNFFFDDDFVSRFTAVRVTVVPTPGAAALFALAVARRRRA